MAPPRGRGWKCSCTAEGPVPCLLFTVTFLGDFLSFLPSYNVHVNSILVVSQTLSLISSTILSVLTSVMS